MKDLLEKVDRLIELRNGRMESENSCGSDSSSVETPRRKKQRTGGYRIEDNSAFVTVAPTEQLTQHAYVYWTAKMEDGDTLFMSSNLRNLQG